MVWMLQNNLNKYTTISEWVVSFVNISFKLITNMFIKASV